LKIVKFCYVETEKKRGALKWLRSGMKEGKTLLILMKYKRLEGLIMNNCQQVV
jgi:hypothetical protein